MCSILSEKKMMETIGSIEYDRKDVLGYGGYGYVYSGTFQGENGERSPSVAVKRILHKDANTNEREVNALKKLKGHPNIVFLFGIEEDINFTYFALERCAASLDQVFLPDDDQKKYKGPLPSDLDTLLQLAIGLRHIHENGFVHRDVKPGNVLIDYPKDDGAVVMKWADFGVSKLVSNRGTFTVSGIRGTMNWIAPEILAILGDEDSKETQRGTVESDTWATGCVFFKFVTKGKHPFGEKNVNANITSGNPVNLAALNDDHLAYNIVREMIQLEPESRMKISDVVEILHKEKEETNQRQQKDNDEMEAGQLYSWEQWKLVLKDGELFVWSDDVTVETVLSPDKTLRIRLNERDKMKVASIGSDSFKFQVEGPGRREGELNMDIFKMLGISSYSAQYKSPLNVQFTSQERKWTFCPSVLGDSLVIKEERPGDDDQMWELVLFGILFDSSIHIAKNGGEKTVCMTRRAQLAMEKELLRLCWPYGPVRPKKLDRIAALLRVGVDPNCRETDGKTPLFLCLANPDGASRLECLKILLEGNPSRGEGSLPRKVDTSVTDRDQSNAFQILLTKNANDGPTVYESLKLLLDGGMDVNVMSKYGRTALHLLCRNYHLENIADVAELLIGKGVDVQRQDIRGRTALHHLCTNNKNDKIIDVMTLLLEKGVDVNVKDKSGSNSLHVLCSNYEKTDNIVDAMKLLMEKGADFNVKDKNGRTALYLLCENPHNIVDAVKLLVKENVDVNVKSNLGRTALHCLCEHYKNGNIVDAVELFIEKGVDVNLQDEAGRTALHWLLLNNKVGNVVDAIKFLVEKGVDVNLKSQNGSTALDYLIKYVYQDENTMFDAVELLI